MSASPRRPRSQPIVRIAIRLVGGPSVGISSGVPDSDAGFPHRLAKRFAGKHLLVELRGEGLGEIVAHSPTGRDNRPHAHADQLARDAGGKFTVLELLLAFRLAVHTRQVATIEEHEVRHLRKLPDFLGG